MKTKTLKYLLMIPLLLSLVFVGCEKEDDRIIDQIYVVRFSLSETDNHYNDFYKIDLSNKEFSIASSVLSTNFVDTFQTTEYSLISVLGDDNIEKFRKSAKKNSFAKWDERYTNPNVYDGGGWLIMIVFSNGDTMTSYGYNAFPSTWNNMKEAFEILLGQDILGSAY